MPRSTEKSDQDKLEDIKAKQGGISVGTKKGRTDLPEACRGALFLRSVGIDLVHCV